jgi:putative membrane protein
VTSSSDTTFIRQALRGNLTEVALGRLADSRAEEDAVEDFARRMIEDHNAMNEEWGDLARENDMQVSVEFGESGEQTIGRLEDLDDRAFDQAYMAEMIRHHERDLAAFQRAASTAGTSDVRRLAASGASTIREHLALARAVGSQVGVATTAGRVGGIPAPTPSPADTGRTRRSTSDTIPLGEAGNRRGDGMRREDRAFIEGALSDHLMHVALARKARGEAKDRETRELAARIEKELTRWAKRWQGFADRREANVAFQLQTHNREKIQRLENASGRKNFDAVYAEIVADHLEMMVDDFRSERREKQPAAVGRLAKEELPLLRELQQRAERIDDRLD